MKPIVLATDGSPTAADATTTAIELATAFDAPLIVATVWEITYQPVGLGFAPVVPDLDSFGREQALEIAEAAAARAREAGLEVEVDIRRGVPAHELCLLAQSRGAQLIVLGSHGWGAFRRMVFGSVSTAVLHRSTVPVLVVPSTAVPGEVIPEREKAEV